jgi:hypothetical protein
LDRGAIDRHVRRARRRYQARRDALLQALARHMPQAIPGGAAVGLHLTAWLPDEADETQIRNHAADQGIAVHTLHHHSALTAPRPPALLLGYGLLPEPAIRPAIEQLAHTTHATTRRRTHRAIPTRDAMRQINRARGIAPYRIHTSARSGTRPGALTLMNSRSPAR